MRQIFNHVQHKIIINYFMDGIWKAGQELPLKNEAFWILKLQRIG